MIRLRPMVHVDDMSAAVRIERPATDEAFGRQLQVTSPDGLLVKIDQLDPRRYT